MNLHRVEVLSFIFLWLMFLSLIRMKGTLGMFDVACNSLFCADTYIWSSCPADRRWWWWWWWGWYLGLVLAEVTEDLTAKLRGAHLLNEMTLERNFFPVELFPFASSQLPSNKLVYLWTKAGGNLEHRPINKPRSSSNPAVVRIPGVIWHDQRNPTFEQQQKVSQVIKDYISICDHVWR